MEKLYDTEIKIAYYCDNEFEGCLEYGFPNTEKGIKLAKVKAKEIYKAVKAENKENDMPMNSTYKVIRVHTLFEYVE